MLDLVLYVLVMCCYLSKFILPFHRDKRCFRLDWPMKPEADFFIHTDVISQRPNEVLIFLSTIFLIFIFNLDILTFS